MTPVIYSTAGGDELRRLRLGDRLVFPELNLIVRSGVNVHLEPKAMEVLLELAGRPGEVVSKEQLLQSVWGGAFICDDVVANAVSLLRRTLGDQAKNSSLIQTIPKRGYRLMVAVDQDLESGGFSGPSAGPLPGRQDELKASLLRVRYLRHEESVASLHSACAYCEEIIRQEPNSAAAHGELVLTLFLLEKLGVAQHREVEASIRTAVDRAMRLDERSGLSLACLAKQEYRYDWKLGSAEQHFRKATEASPRDADVVSEYSIMLSVVRRFDESLTFAGRALALDPMSPAARLQAGHTNYASGQWEDAISHYRRLLRFTPQHIFARWGLADALNRTGMPCAAIEILKEGISMGGSLPSPVLLTSLSRISASTEAAGGSRQVNEFGPPTDLMLLAELHCFRGELAEAFRLLDQAAETRHYRLAAVNMFPQFERLRQDPRCRQLLARAGLLL